MPLPDITHLQFVVVGLLLSGELPGQSLRDGLSARGIEKEGPAFYQAMGRLERAGLVTGRYTQEVIDGQISRQRLYRATAAGRKACRSTQKFYSEAAI